ncbi:MAG: hypothetical protein KF752_12165 [Pirellulaceae bacterium]|nr:hypothetical protein [Pirellulaceae bacterium]
MLAISDGGTTDPSPCGDGSYEHAFGEGSDELANDQRLPHARSGYTHSTQ